MENQNLNKSQKKIKFGENEYLFDDLPEEAKSLISGLRAADAQINMHQDALKLISYSKEKMIVDLKKFLDDIIPVS